MEIKLVSSLFFFFFQCLIVLSSAQDFDFFYFVQQWPGSYCDTRQSCCYPTTGKPASDFLIRGLWPYYNDGSYPSNCDSSNAFDLSQHNTLSCPSNSGINLWSREWNRHGTCSESVLDQYGYFNTALTLKSKINLLQILQGAGIDPDDGFYSLGSISSAIKSATGYTPGIECNADSSRNSQLYQIYFCIDNSGSNLIECPVLPRRGRCGSRVEFPSFSGASTV